MKNILDSIFALLYNKKMFYGFFYHLFLIGLKGIEQGRNYGMISTSGELRVVNLTERYFKNPVIIDGGANIGEYSLACCKIDKSKIFAFEPSSPTFLILQNNIKDISNIRPIQLALSNEPQELLLRYDFEGSGIASVVECNFDHYGLKLEKQELIKATTLDLFCEQNEIDHVNLLKLDIEGYEYTALKGAKRMIENERIDLIQFEMGRANVDSKTFFKDFYLYLRDRFDIYRILSFGFVPIIEYSYEYEIFMGCNFIAVRKGCKVVIN
jgi:FkbM family methyltransferase